MRIDRVPLIVGLYLLLEPLDLTCAYRFERLWVTSRDNPLFDKDCTGVEAL